MIAHWTEYTRLITALFVIVDPFAAIPLFLSLTHGYASQERTRVALITTLTVFAVLMVSALIGERLLGWMGTSLPSFRVGGGIVLLLMALAMLQGQPDMVRATPSESEEAASKESVAVVPLAIPLLAGPGAISTVIIAMHRSDAQFHWLAVIICIILVTAVVWLVLWLAEVLAQTLGQIGMNIINRVFGLVVAAVAIEIMANGLKQLFPVLAR